MKISFFVPGIPAPGGSKKGYVRGGRVCIVDDAKRNKSWRERVASVASDHLPGGQLLSGALEVTFNFTLPRPKSHYYVGKRLGILRDNAPVFHTKKPDALKLARSTEDALTGILWKDDCYTVDLHILKYYGERPGVTIRIWTREGA